MPRETTMRRYRPGRRQRELDRTSFAQWYKKGIALRKLGRYDEAAAALEKALLLEPKNADAWRAHALVCSQMDRNAEAAASC